MSPVAFIPPRHALAGYGLALYGIATRALRPAVPLVLSARRRRGKEDPARLNERRGIASQPRPAGRLVWFHAASVGEAQSVLPLMERLQAARPDTALLMTTGTVTSAQLMAGRLPQGAIHQFAPLDHPAYCARFIAHWKPDLAVWVESEFWPNLILATHRSGIPLALVNARMSERSFRGWRRFRALAADLLGRFSLLLAQDAASAARLAALGAKEVATPGNLKHDAAPLSASESELAALRAATQGRPLWLATNTHEGEEAVAGEVHRQLAGRHPGLLTLIVPRHPARGSAIAAELTRQGLRCAQRAPGEAITPATDVYIADTLGEVGLFYRLADIVFIGGTLAPIGGHNPFEPARLRCALIAGPSDFNFTETFAAFEKEDALIRSGDTISLMQAVEALLDHEDERHRRAEAAHAIATSDSGAAERTLAALLTFLPDEKTQTGGGARAHA